MTSSRPARRFDWTNLGIRVASAAVLIPAVVFAILSGKLWIPPFQWLGPVGDWPFLMMVTAGVAMLAVEWGGMSAPGAQNRTAVLIVLAVLACLFVANLRSDALAWPLAWLCILPGALIVALAAWRFGERPPDAAFGVIYIAGPVLALSWLRSMPNPISWTILLFAVTWSADICAFLAGNALKGPKLSPRYSPNKTWTGFFGGLAGGMAAAVAITLVTADFHGARLTLEFASVVGLAGGLATMAGDLWESILKRRYGVKDSGDLIPGHGGLLDRVDGLMFAALAVAGARLIHQIGWAQ